MPGIGEFARLYRAWPFLASVLDNAEMILAKADMGVARRYASLASGPDAERCWAAIEAEYHRTVALAAADHRTRPAARRRAVLQRSIALRNPYVDSLSELQVRLLAPPAGIAAGRPGARPCCGSSSCRSTASPPGLQNTG